MLPELELEKKIKRRASVLMQPRTFCPKRAIKKIAEAKKEEPKQMFEAITGFLTTEMEMKSSIGKMEMKSSIGKMEKMESRLDVQSMTKKSNTPLVDLVRT